MILRLFLFMFRFLCRTVGISFEGIDDFESETQCRLKLNNRIQKIKSEDGLPIFEGTLKDAEEIAKESNGLLALIFLNENDGNSRDFEEKVLNDSEFKTFVRNVSFKTVSLVLFDVNNHYHFIASKKLGIRRFPSIMIKTHLQEKFQTIFCYEGYLDCAGTCGLIQSVLLACEAEIAQAAEISSMRAIQNEQDAAYYRSLEIDKIKMRSKAPQCKPTELETTSNTTNAENIEAGSEPEPELVTNIQNNDNLLERIEEACRDLQAESYEDSIRFQFVFPDGKRHMRRFSPTTTIKEGINI